MHLEKKCESYKSCQSKTAKRIFRCRPSEMAPPLSKYIRILIVNLKYSGSSHLEIKRIIAERFGRDNSKTSITRTLRNFEKEGSILNQNSGRSGRPKKITDTDTLLRLERALISNPEQSIRRNSLNLSRTSFIRARKLIKFSGYRLKKKFCSITSAETSTGKFRKNPFTRISR